MNRVPPRPGAPARQGLMKLLMLILLPLWLLIGQPAQAQTGAKGFDHTRTGFILSGVHASERCESCHINGVFKGTPRDCTTCHSSGARQSRGNTVKSANHLPTSAPCETCHSTQSFSGARFSHAGVARGTCMTCHNGRTAPGKSANHIVTAASCDSCHRSSAWLPAAGFDHAGVTAGTCASCHNGARATGRSAVHVPNTAVSGIGNASCDSCHKSGFKSWLPARVHSSFSVIAQCATCHTGRYAPAVGKPNTPIHATATTCENCHKSTASWTAGTRVDHSTFTAATNCASCHNGSTATGKTPTHIPTGTASCVACHTTSGWVPSSWNHSQVIVAGQCASCHNGSLASGKSANHVATTASCDSCHRGTTSWASATFAHSAANAVGTGSCDGCHNNVGAKGKPATHIPVPAGAARCDSCHRSQSSFAAAVTMNHSVVTTASCKGCHSGAYVSQGTVGALAKPANHIPEGTQLLNGSTLDCNACHSGTTVWSSVRMNHNNSLGNGAGWCKGCHQTGTAFLGNMEKKSLTHERSSPLPTDCSQSGCHRPLGTKGAAYTKWD